MTMWTSIPDFPGYEAHPNGWVRGPQGMMAGTITARGYTQLCLSGTMVLLHRVILSTFDRLPEPGEEGRHLDGDPSHNALGNLAWGTSGDNAKDMLKHGTVSRGEDRHNAVLSAQAVKGIVALVQAGATHTEAAIAYNVSRPTVSYIMAGKTWKHVTEGLL